MGIDGNNRIPIEVSAGKRPARLLKSFSESADKSRVYLNEHDKRSWLDFLISSHLNDSELSSEELFDWIIENGWHGKTARILTSEYKNARALLKKYSKNR